MTPPRSLVGSVAGMRLFASFRMRALVFGLLTLICLALALFPERHRAAVTLSPTDPGSLGLSGTLGQLGAISNVFGNQAAVEVALRVGNSVYVRDIVIKQLKLADRLGEHDRRDLHRWLERKVEVRSLRGGIVLIEMKDRDSALARDVVRVYASATQARLAQISRNQTAYKRDVLEQLVADASKQLAVAQSAYDAFRLRNSAPSPQIAIESVSQRIPMLENGIKAQEIQLSTALQLYGEENQIIRQMRAQLAALRRQLAETRATAPGDDSTVGRAVSTSSQLFQLERELITARTLYDSYLRYLQGTAVENLTSTANVRILEPAFVDTERQVWWPALAAAIASLLLWGAVEFYRMRPPLGAPLPAGARGD